MAKLVGPLFSQRASGTLANSFTFRTQRGQNVVHKKLQASSSDSVAQLERRAIYAGICSTWNTLDAPTKAAWVLTGKASGITGFNAYCSAELIAAYSASPDIVRVSSVSSAIPFGYSVQMNLIRGNVVFACAASFQTEIGQLSDDLGNTWTAIDSAYDTSHMFVSFRWFFSVVEFGGDAIISMPMPRAYSSIRAVQYSGLSTGSVFYGDYQRPSAPSTPFDTPDARCLILMTGHVEPNIAPVYTPSPSGSSQIFASLAGMDRPIFEWVTTGVIQDFSADAASSNQGFSCFSTIGFRQ